MRRKVGADTEGFALTTGLWKTQRWRWDSVKRIIAYKVDLFTYDEIVVRFEFHDGSTVNIGEEDRGFADFMAQMGRAIPAIAADWYLTIMLPVFEATPRILYEA